MGQVRLPTPVKYFCALLIAPSISQPDVEAALEPVFGPVTHRSPSLSFTQTTYYEREMGVGLVRSYIAFEPLRSMGEDSISSVYHLVLILDAWMRGLHTTECSALHGRAGRGISCSSCSGRTGSGFSPVRTPTRSRRSRLE